MQNNNLPDGWKIVKLKDYTTERKQKNKANEELTVFSISNKRGFVKSDDYFEGQVYSKDLKNYKIVKKGDFAYNPARINVGSIAYLESEEIGLLSPMYVIFSLNKEIDKDYFSYFIKGNLFNKQVNNFTQGAVRQILSFGDLGNISLLLPPLEVQQEIAGKLNDLDKLIQTQNNQIEKYEQLKKAMMKKLFSEGIGHTEFKEDKYLGKIPKEWECETIGNLTYLDNKINLNGLDDNEKVGFIGMTDLSDNGNIIIHEKELVEVKKGYSRFKNGDIIFAKITPCMENGKSGILNDNNYKCYFGSTEFIVITCKKELLNKFLLPILKLDSFLKLAEMNMTGSVGHKRVPKDFIKSFKIGLPKLKEQKKIADILENIDNLLEKESEIKEGYEKVKKGIVSLVFSCNLLIK